MMAHFALYPEPEAMLYISCSGRVAQSYQMHWPITVKGPPKG
jgi:hypothetical protein